MSNSILDLPFILETRRNHALEHATLHVLAEKYSHQSMAGHSNPTGFFILGDLPTDDVQSAATQALTRLARGRKRSRHPSRMRNQHRYYCASGRDFGLAHDARREIHPRSDYPHSICDPICLAWRCIESALRPDHSATNHHRCRHGQSANRGGASIFARTSHRASGDYEMI